MKDRRKERLELKVGIMVSVALLLLGMTYRETGQVEQSALAFDKLLKRHPGSIWAYEVSQYWPHAARTRWTSAAP